MLYYSRNTLIRNLATLGCTNGIGLSLNNCNLKLLKHFRHSAAAHFYRSCVHRRTNWKALDCRPKRFTDGKTGHTFSTAICYVIRYMYMVCCLAAVIMLYNNVRVMQLIYYLNQ